MKFVFLIAILKAFAFATFGQNTSCPKISVTGPSKIIQIGEPMIFTANISGIDLDKLKYQWTVSNGTISSGQGTTGISVATTDDLAGMTITATVEVSGLSENCRNSFSIWGEIDNKPVCGFPAIIDEFGKISWKDEKSRLESLITELKHDTNVKAVFMVSVKERQSSDSLKLHLEKIAGYLTKTRKIPSNQINFIFGGVSDYSIRIYLFPIQVDLSPLLDKNQDDLKENLEQQIDQIISTKNKSQSKRK